MRLSFAIRSGAKRPRRKWIDQVDEQVKEARNQDLLTVVDAAAKRAGERLVGHEVEILCEGPSKTNRRAPDGSDAEQQDRRFRRERGRHRATDRFENHALDRFQFVGSESGRREQLSFCRDGRTSAARRGRSHDLSPFFAYRRVDRRRFARPA